ncbi:hypothetical protein [Jeotgalibacillus soli]|uniref:BppU N-terminal domain-containing protein n=1 Tax=Jeotgalibacillus soli TaxID=889306 RepID=A0A0C2RVH7_9BACL|nr:hypothetical protein [Jeotgalibacillus soli]KIL45769.1 hypothetical protein KP78_21180 [Jeotgalibacillus soli]
MYLPINRAEFIAGNIAKAGDTKNEFVIQLLDRNGARVDLTGATVTWTAASRLGRLIAPRAATILTDGQVSVKFQDADPIGVGEIFIELTVTRGDGLVEKFPAEDNLIMRVTKSQDDVTYTPVNFATIDYLLNLINTIVQRETDSNAESAQARVRANGTTYPTLKGRLDNDDTQFNAHTAALFSSGVHGMGRIASQDYEEGVWTPVIQGLTTAGSNTYSTQDGRYAKVGGRLYFDAFVSLSLKDVNMAGEVAISGLPFVVRNTIGYRPNGVVPIFSSLTLDATRPYLGFLALPNESRVRLRKSGDNVSNVGLVATQINNTTFFQISGSYLI